VDVVHLAAEFLEILVQKGLHGGNTQLLFGMGNGDEAGLALIVIGKHMALALALVAIGIELLQLGHQVLGLHAKEHAVDGLKLQGIVVVIHHLHQGVAGRQSQVLLGGLSLLLLLIAGLGSGQGVAIAYGEQQGCRAGKVVLGHLGLVGAQAGECVGHGIDLGIGELIALDVSAILHQVEVIHHLHAVSGSGKRLDDGLFGVVDEQHHVGQLDGSVAAHPGARRNTILDGSLSGTDQCAGTRGEVISIQVYHAHQAMADLAVGLLPLHIDQGVGQGLEHAVIHVFFHGGVDILDELIHIGGLQIGLGQNEAQGGWGITYLLFHRFPVLRLGRKLVAGHHGPLGHVAILRHQNVGRIEAQLLKLLVHVVPPIQKYIASSSFCFYPALYISPPPISITFRQITQDFLGALTIFASEYFPPPWADYPPADYFEKGGNPS